MLLYDVGNSNIKCYDNGSIEIVDSFDKRREFYYISVNREIKEYKNGINLEPYFNLQSSYIGLGVDRVAACYGIDDGVIVDVGSAITVDVMDMNRHKGGFILPGIGAYKKSLFNISKVLDFDIDSRVDFKKLPLNTQDALNFGLFKSIFLMIKDISKGKKIYFCGGDGKIVSRFFKNSIYKEDLVFIGMKRAIKEMKC